MDDDAELTFLLGLSFQVVLGEFVRRLDAAGYDDLRPIHGLALQALKDGGATGTELAERLGVTKQAAGQVITYLQERGYVERGPHPRGGRWQLVVLSGKAREHLTVAGRTLHALESELGADVDLPALRRGLGQVIHTLAGDALPPLRPVW